MLEGQDDFKIVGEAADGAQAVALAAPLQPAVVLMDLRMPHTDGVAATAQLSKTLPHVRVLALTTYNSGADILRASQARATGYLLKDAPREELFRAIRAAVRGKAVLSPAVAARVMGKMRAPAHDTLTAREVDVRLPLFIFPTLPRAPR